MSCMEQTGIGQPNIHTMQTKLLLQAHTFYFPDFFHLLTAHRAFDHSRRGPTLPLRTLWAEGVVITLQVNEHLRIVIYA